MAQADQQCLQCTDDRHNDNEKNAKQFHLWAQRLRLRVRQGVQNDGELARAVSAHTGAGQRVVVRQPVGTHPAVVVLVHDLLPTRVHCAVGSIHALLDAQDRVGG